MASAPAPRPNTPAAIDPLVTPDGRLRWQGREFAAALGAGGITTAKREGDGATPAGAFSLRRVLYRPDRLAPPRTRLPVAPIGPRDGWCDDPADPLYNQQIRQPFAGGFELMWRDERLYDVVVVLGVNDSPVVPGAGSAIFLHVAAPDFLPTRGCVALSQPDLLELLKGCDARARLWVLEGTSGD